MNLFKRVNTKQTMNQVVTRVVNDWLATHQAEVAYPPVTIVAGQRYRVTGYADHETKIVSFGTTARFSDDGLSQHMIVNTVPKVYFPIADAIVHPGHFNITKIESIDDE